MFRGLLAPDAAYDLIINLPREAALWAAMAEDAEGAQLMADGGPRPPRLTEFGPVVEALAEVHDLLARLLAVQVAFAGGKPPEVRPYPRPVAAAAQARLSGRIARHKALVARVLRR